MQPYIPDLTASKIVLLENIHQSAVEQFTRCDFNDVVSIAHAPKTDKELIEVAKDAVFLGIRSRTQITERVLEELPDLIALGCFCIGTNQVNLDAARSQGVPVFNAPFSNTRSVAEMVIAEAILLLRKIPEKNALAHQGRWEKSPKNCYEIRGKTLGIIGYGNIGSQLSILAEGIGMRVIFYDVMSKLALGNAVQVQTLQALLSESDVVSLHVPELPSTELMIGADELKLMNKNAVLINASRGSVVDIDALADALEQDRIAGAAVDVFPSEPASNEQPFINPLQAFGNVILTPHIGGSTMEAQENIGEEVANKLIRYAKNGSTIGAVNFPEVNLPSHLGKHRLLHIHLNIPGVMSEINQIFSENEINIAGQYLQTNEAIGYVVIDVDAEYGAFSLKCLAKVKGTIKVRALV